MTPSTHEEKPHLSKKRKAPSDAEKQPHHHADNGENNAAPTALMNQPQDQGQPIDAVPDSQQQETEMPDQQAASRAPAEQKQTANTAASAAKKNPYDNLHYCIVTNDGQHDSLVKLIGLKQLFAKQLPKMPRAYIARLVFDRRHTSLAILSDDPQHKGTDDEIIGGICYRGFDDMRFAEIAFCAVNGSHQVKVRSNDVCLV